MSPPNRPSIQRFAQRISWLNLLGGAAVLLAAVLIIGKNWQASATPDIVNVSYDVTAPLYTALDQQFITQYQKQTGKKLRILVSHGGSSRQARSVISGEQKADVVTLGLALDVNSIADRGLIAANWQSRLPNNAIPYTSTIVFVVRKGNPKNIRDWPDLIKNGVSIILPNPATSGNGKLAVLAAWGAVTTRGGSDADATAYLKALLQHVLVFDVGASGAATTFTVANTGDVQLAWENEALQEVEADKADFQIVYPPVSILAQPAVAWVDANLSNSRKAAYSQAYLQYLFTDPAQEIIARSGYRPIDPKVQAEYVGAFPDIKLFPVTAVARDWVDAQTKFFGPDGIVSVVWPAKTN